MQTINEFVTGAQTFYSVPYKCKPFLSALCLHSFKHSPSVPLLLTHSFLLSFSAHLFIFNKARSVSKMNSRTVSIVA